MIEKFSCLHLDEIMAIWLDGNLRAHPFIPAEFWTGAFDEVKAALPDAELYFFQEAGAVKGFIGLTDASYIAGLFVAAGEQSRGLGRALLDHCKKLHRRLELDVFAENRRAVDFYLKNGFAIKSERYNPDFTQVEYRMSWP